MSDPKKLGSVWPPDPFSTPTPKDGGSGLEEAGLKDPPSKVTNAPQLYRKVEKIEGVLNRLVEPISQIPDIRNKVENIVERVVRVEEQIKVTKEDVTDLEGNLRRPHDCFQVDNIERIEVAGLSVRKDVEEDTRKIDVVVSEITEIKENAKMVKDVRRTNYYFWVGTLITFLFSAAGAIWYARGISADIQLEAQAREIQLDQVEHILDKVSVQTDPGPMKERIETLQTTVEQNGDAHMAEWCAKLSDEDVERLKSTLPRKSWPKCTRINVP